MRLPKRMALNKKNSAVTKSGKKVFVTMSKSFFSGDRVYVVNVRKTESGIFSGYQGKELYRDKKKENVKVWLKKN